MADIYEEVALDLYIEEQNASAGAPDPSDVDYYTEHWEWLGSGKAPYLAAAERLVNKYQARFLGEEPSRWWPDGDVDEAFNEPTTKEGEGLPNLRITIEVLGR